MLRVLAFVHKQKGISPGQRFRVEQWEPHLRAQHGIEVDYSIYESPRLSQVIHRPGHLVEKATWLLWDTWRRRDAVQLARHYDAALVYREMALLGPELHERRLARTGIPFILDFDDAIWLPSPPAATRLVGNTKFAWLRFPEKTARIAKLAAAVTVGNAYLGAWARQHNEHVQVVPTGIDLDLYGVQPEPDPTDAFVIVWIGSFSTLRYLELARGPIERLARERRVELRVICDRPLEPGFAGVDMKFVPWTAEGEAREIGRGHVGIMPLDDTMLSRGKCACKALQYMAVGRASVVAPVGVNRDIVRHDVNGLLAGSDEEWYRSLRRLAEDPALRARLAREGRRTVEGDFHAAASAAKFANVVHSVVARRRDATADTLSRGA